MPAYQNLAAIQAPDGIHLAIHHGDGIISVVQTAVQVEIGQILTVLTIHPGEIAADDDIVLAELAVIDPGRIHGVHRAGGAGIGGERTGIAAGIEAAVSRVQGGDAAPGRAVVLLEGPEDLQVGLVY